jgi:hypothetical protein
VHRRTPRQTRRAALALALSAQAALALAASAHALSLPAVATGPAHAVTYASALITGSVNPNGSETSYYVQYGQTKAYGAQTAIGRAGAGTHAVPVSVPLGGLQPLTEYHYRVVAVNSVGVTDGADAKFVTTKVPLSLQIVTAPNPIPFGGAIVIDGTLSGTGNGGREVVLQANSFPFTAGFQNVGNPELTTSTGGFSFTLLGMTLVTQFRVVGVTSPPVVSPVAVEAVAARVRYRVGRSHRAHHVRFSGSVAPAEDGAHVGILRIVHGRGVLVAGAVLRHADPSRSSFSADVRFHRGLYRVLVVVTNGAQVSAYGPSVFLR